VWVWASSERSFRDADRTSTAKSDRPPPRQRDQATEDDPASASAPAPAPAVLVVVAISSPASSGTSAGKSWAMRMRREAPVGVSAAAVPSVAMTTRVRPDADHASDAGGALLPPHGTAARSASDLLNSSTAAADQGLTLAHLRAQLEGLRDTLLNLELNVSTFGTHPRVDLGYVGDKGSLN